MESLFPKNPLLNFFKLSVAFPLPFALVTFYASKITNSTDFNKTTEIITFPASNIVEIMAHIAEVSVSTSFLTLSSIVGLYISISLAIILSDKTPKIKRSNLAETTEVALFIFGFILLLKIFLYRVNDPASEDALTLLALMPGLYFIYRITTDPPIHI